MTTIQDALKQIKLAQNEVNKNMCDTLKGDCNLCPFKNQCIAELLVDIQLNVESIELDLKKLLK